MLNTLNSSGKPAFAGPERSAYATALFHSARVRRLKILLPVAAVIISLAFIAVSMVRAYLPENLKIEGAKIEDGKIVMEKPAIAGRNADGINYSMLAERALQDIKNPNLITLETIKAAVPVNDDLIARVEAATADYDRSTDNLALRDPFTILLSNGLTAKFQSAKLDIKGGKMTTDDPIEIQKDGASIVAQSLKMTDKGRVITFEGKVRMNVDPSVIRKQGT
ncbi:lipopolysccharide assembly LptC-related protein [Rhizobium etli 8C-3]|uniref:Lipopolysaccharide export system protein LptC n=2 Tax=Rhizobium TaxID=379 RepID=A0A4R3QYT3_9HYPH|nr:MULTISPECIES: LPS export ABC transporter periplasmic protein LptC [Rhizobium]APO73290.1 lipopolysccharide assembly LptC-related protein [Rhizobium etli 8C-3]TCU26607.1 lipopolysaccharide export system protein LptC [Rhizobium azibense]TCU38521.1 lipopolysaccharide export system protein LptC [Rhizobium azibense]